MDAKDNGMRAGFDEFVLRSRDYGATEEEGSRLLWDLWQAACKWQREKGVATMQPAILELTQQMGQMRQRLDEYESIDWKRINAALEKIEKQEVRRGASY